MGCGVCLRISLPPSVEWSLEQVQQSRDGRKTDAPTSVVTVSHISPLCHLIKCRNDFNF